MVSLRGKFLNWYFTRTGFKHGMLKDIKHDNRRAAEPKPKVMARNSVEVREFQGRKLWYIHPKSGKVSHPKKVVIFFHGGAYFYDLMDVHFPAWAKIADQSNTLVILPSYPLAPESSPVDTAKFAQDVLQKVRSDLPDAQIISGGCSAGAGLALQACQLQSKEGEAQPAHLILWSPWADVSDDNPALIAQDKRSTVIGLDGLKIAAALYRGDIDPKDPRVSPVYGDLACLPPMTIVTGTRDLLHPNIMQFAEASKAAEASVDLQVWDGQNHYFMYLPQPEAAAVYTQTAALINAI